MNPEIEVESMHNNLVFVPFERLYFNLKVLTLRLKNQFNSAYAV